MLGSVYTYAHARFLRHAVHAVLMRGQVSWTREELLRILLVLHLSPIFVSACPISCCCPRYLTGCLPVCICPVFCRCVGGRQQRPPGRQHAGQCTLPPRVRLFCRLRWVLFIEGALLTLCEGGYIRVAYYHLKAFEHANTSFLHAAACGGRRKGHWEAGWLRLNDILEHSEAVQL